MEIVHLNDYELLAKQKLSEKVYDYYAGGADTETTLSSNLQCYDKIKLIPRVLQNAPKLDLAIELYNQKLSAPLMIAPIAFHQLAHPNGESETMLGASLAKVPMVYSTMANIPLEKLNSHQNLWMQLYFFENENITLELVRKAEHYGCSALVVTVDSQALGYRIRDLKNKFSLPQHLILGNIHHHFDNSTDNQSKEHTQAGSEKLFKKQLSWEDILWLKQQTTLPILLKGILHTKDAELALQYNLDGIIVSNHGGRQLDTAITALDALPDIAGAIQHKIPIITDGGIRKGTDIFKALALGANAVMIGRPVIWALATQGHTGVAHMLNLLKTDLNRTMQLMGFNNIEEIIKYGKDCLQICI